MESVIQELQVYFSRGNAWSPLWITLKTGGAATLLSFFVGLMLARWVMKLEPKKRALIDSLLTLPMVLPPTVMGFFLLVLFSKKRLLGRALDVAFGIVLPGTWAACVLAAFVISMPLMYKNTRAAFEQMDDTMIDAARMLGAGERTILWKVIIPNAMPGIASGTILAFARAVGEYGATSMFAGNILGRTSTISQQIAVQMGNDNWAAAGVWTVIIVLLSLGVVYLINVFSGEKFQNKRFDQDSSKT